MVFEICKSFDSIESWVRWRDKLPELGDPHYIDELVRSILATGFVDPSFGTARAHEIKADTDNYRESLLWRGATCRYRALLRPAVDYLLACGWCSPVYLSEHATNFGELAPVRFPYLLRSEYMPNPATRHRYPHIHHEDPTHLTFPDGSFDLYISADNMIYAPTLDGFLGEAYRILRRGGMLLATFPFRYGEPDTELLASMTNGEVVHHATPLLHQDPLDGDRSRLVFFIPGWDILEIARGVGFNSAEIIIYSSRINAILGREIAGVFVLKATA
jgi:SAM-dependent methyltransferase